MAAAARELAGKVALVTGGGRNIGRAISLALADAGATVAVNTRKSRDDADQVVRDIQSAGGKAELCMADISDANAVQAMVDGIVQRHGRLDILVLNASVRNEVPFENMTYEQWHSILGITLDGAFFCTKACLPHMLKAGAGSIVTLGGMVSLSGAKRRVHGSTAKHGLVGMTRALAREFADRNIRANCIAPGQMNTARAAGRTIPTDASAIPMKRQGEADEIATTARFLCGPGASYITGQTIHVNGGMMMF
jgi:3-oxoacyl-[acyl-carrier protein] reductase